MNIAHPYPWGQEEAQYQAKVCGNIDSNPVGPICGNWDQIWPQVWPPELFSQLGPVLGQKGPLGPPVSTYKAPEWANMTYHYVSYPWVVLGPFGPFQDRDDTVLLAPTGALYAIWVKKHKNAIYSNSPMANFWNFGGWMYPSIPSKKATFHRWRIFCRLNLLLFPCDYCMYSKLPFYLLRGKER